MKGHVSFSISKTCLEGIFQGAAWKIQLAQAQRGFSNHRLVIEYRMRLPRGTRVGETSNFS